VALLVLLYLDRNQWFFYDEWEFLAARGLGGQSLRLFFPHNEHWSTVPILIFRGLYALFGLRTYFPYIFLTLLSHLATAYVLWRVLLRVGADGWVATALVAIFLVLGAGYENLIWAFQVGWIISTLSGLGLLILADHAASRFVRRDVAVWLVAVIGLMSSGIGITMVAVAGVVALLRRGWRAASVTISIPALVYLAWLAIIGHQGLAATHVTGGTLLLIPDFIWKGLTNTVDTTTGLIGFGAVAVIGLLVWLVFNARLAGSIAPAFAGAIGAVVFFGITGLGRSSFGIDQATGPRYVYVAFALLIPIIAVALSAPARRGFIAQFVIVLLAIFALVHNVDQLVSQARVYGEVKQNSKQQILAGGQLITAGAPLIGQHPDPQWAPDLTTQDLRFMIRDGALPPATEITEKQRLDAVLALQLDLTAGPEVTGPASVAVQAGPGGALQSDGTDCMVAKSYGVHHKLLLQFAQPASVQVTTMASEQIDVVLGEVPGQSSDPRHLNLIAGHPMFLSVAASAVTLTLDLPPDDLQVCGAMLRQ
jgi:hypothetical protein